MKVSFLMICHKDKEKKLLKNKDFTKESSKKVLSMEKGNWNFLMALLIKAIFEKIISKGMEYWWIKIINMKDIGIRVWNMGKESILLGMVVDTKESINMIRSKDLVFTFLVMEKVLRDNGIKESYSKSFYLEF